MKMLKTLRLALAALFLAAPLFAWADSPIGGAASQQFYTAVAPATPAVTAVKASATSLAYLAHVSCFNTLATPVYIKLFNAAPGSVTLGTTAAAMNFMCPGSTAGAGFVQNFAFPLAFSDLVYAVTGGIALNDDTSISANAVAINITYY